MADYIDREEIVKVAEHAYSEWNLAMAAADGEREINRVFKMKELCRAVEAVAKRAPAADVAPVVHGEWLTVTDNDEYWGAMEYNKCSICGKITYGADNYCRNCGAKMDGGK